MSKPKISLPILIPGTTVFISSFCIMVLELVAARLIARHLGSSLYTWTAVIGIVLAGITIGNYIGGRIADRFNTRKTLAVLFAICSVSCVITIILNNLIGNWMWLWKFSWPTRVFTHVFLVFMFPSALLGTISPVVAKMALDRGLPTGRTVGDIYAAGAAGSIAGTFAAGYWLIATMGTLAIIWSIGAVLLVMAILYWARPWLIHLWALLFICALVMGVAPTGWCKAAGAALALQNQPDPTIIYQDETQYCYAYVKQVTKSPDKRIFMLDKLKHSTIVMDDITNLQYFYTKIFSAITHRFSTEKKRLSVLVIGGGGYVYPRYVHKTWPDSRVDVVEIDPGVTEAAMQAFGLDRDTPINTITMDARNYVDTIFQQQPSGETKTRYDFIYEDAINDYSVPYQLTTLEFNEKIARLLTYDGVYMLNLIDIFDSGLFLGAVFNTLQQTFPYVYVLAEPERPRSQCGTFVLIASKCALDIADALSSHNYNVEAWHLDESEIEALKEKSGSIILTDDYAPVENMLAPLVRKSALGILVERYMEEAQELARQDKISESIAKFHQALQADSSVSVLVYKEIAAIMLKQGNLEGAVEAFRNAIKFDESDQDMFTGDMVPVHYNLGRTLKRLHRDEEALPHLKKAIEGFREKLTENPRSVRLLSRLGNALAEAGDFKQAAETFKKALELNPDSLPGYVSLAMALEFQGRHDEAIDVLRRGIEFMRQQGKQADVVQLQRNLELLELKKSQRDNRRDNVIN